MTRARRTPAVPDGPYTPTVPGEPTRTASIAARARSVGTELMAGAALMFLAVPQSVAYATIAGLPPAMGLYAAALPPLVGTPIRSARHVIAGPTNALSLLVGATLASRAGIDPIQGALVLAVMVGVFQVLAGLLRLGALVDYISSAVVLGYVTGAGVLIGIGQLHAATGTEGPSGAIWTTVAGWLAHLDSTHVLSATLSVGTIALLASIRLVNRRIARRIPGSLVALTVATGVSILADLKGAGVRVVADLAPIPLGLPPFAVPDWSLLRVLLGGAVACTVLSLVESTSVARSIAARTGEQLDASREFLGQGVANVAAGFFGGYPVSGSLSRSAISERSGAKTRLAGAASGALMLGVLLFAGPLLDHTPLPALAGLLMVVAWDLVDVPRIRATVRTSSTDAAAFLVTVVGTWVLSLDLAIYLGVAISLASFLRQARLLEVREMVFDDRGALREIALRDEPPDSRCPAIRLLHVQGTLFFGAAGELRAALDTIARDPELEVLVVRLKRARDIDATSAETLAAFATLMHERGKHLLLVGLTARTRRVLERSGAATIIGKENLFEPMPRLFEGLSRALERARELCGERCRDCPRFDVLAPVSDAPQADLAADSHPGEAKSRASESLRGRGE